MGELSAKKVNGGTKMGGGGGGEVEVEGVDEFQTAKSKFMIFLLSPRPLE